MVLFVFEYLLDWEVEEASQAKRERKGGVESSALDRDDGLSGDAEFFGEALLGPFAFPAQLGKLVLHAQPWLRWAK